LRRIVLVADEAPAAHHRAGREVGARRDPAGAVATFGAPLLILFILFRQLVKLG